MSETTLPPPPQWTPAPPPSPAATTRVPFHTRVVGIWWAIGVALACLVVGAGTGSLVTHLAERNPSPTRFQRLPDGFGPNGFPGPQLQFRGGGGPNGFPGQGQLAPGQVDPNVVPPNNGS